MNATTEINVEIKEAGRFYVKFMGWCGVIYISGFYVGVKVLEAVGYM